MCSGTAEHGTTAELEEVAAPVGDSPEATQATTEQQVTSHALPDLFGAEELLTELQDERAFGKRGEVWTLARIAVIGLVLLPPFQLVVRTASYCIAALHCIGQPVLY